MIIEPDPITLREAAMVYGCIGTALSIVFLMAAWNSSSILYAIGGAIGFIISIIVHLWGFKFWKNKK